MFRLSKRFLALFLIITLALTALGCSARPGSQKPPEENQAGAGDARQSAKGGYPLAVTDDLGRKVTFESRPERIVSLSPSGTEILFALGLGPRVVGVDKFSDYPDEAAKVEKVGGFSDPSLEKIASLKPDLVVGVSIQQKFLDQFDKLNIPVVILAPKTVEGVLSDIKLIGEITDRREQAERVAGQITGTLKDIGSKLGNLPENSRPRTYYEVYSDPIMSVGPKTLIHELIVLAGGDNIARDADVEYPKLSPEAILKRNPQVIIFPRFHGSASLTADQLKSRPGWEGIEAIKAGRVYSIDANLISRSGPRIAQAAQELARLIHPDRFPR